MNATIARLAYPDVLVGVVGVVVPRSHSCIELRVASHPWQLAQHLLVL